MRASTTTATSKCLHRSLAFALLGFEGGSALMVLAVCLQLHGASSATLFVPACHGSVCSILLVQAVWQALDNTVGSVILPWSLGGAFAGAVAGLLLGVATSLSQYAQFLREGRFFARPRLIPA